MEQQLTYNGDSNTPMSPTTQQNNLLSIQRARKQIESDAQLLANRIALLKQEELKSWKKIEETKKKAKEVYMLKKKNEERMAEKQRIMDKKNANIANAQQGSVEFRRQKEKEKEDMLSNIYNSKHKTFMNQKKQSQKNDLKKKNFENKVIETNQAKSMKIKEQESLVLLKKKEMEAEKLLQNRLNYEKKCSEEEGLKRKKEQEVLAMEKLEMELIKRLQHTQSLQKAAYEELESALAQSAEDYAKKYFSENSPDRSPGGFPQQESESVEASPKQENTQEDAPQGDEVAQDEKINEAAPHF